MKSIWFGAKVLVYNVLGTESGEGTCSHHLMFQAYTVNSVASKFCCTFTVHVVMMYYESTEKVLKFTVNCVPNMDFCKFILAFYSVLLWKIKTNKQGDDVMPYEPFSRIIMFYCWTYSVMLQGECTQR